MTFKDTPIKGKLKRVILLTTSAVLLITCPAFFAYEFFTFRHTTVSQITTLGKIVAFNSTAALAFDNRAEAEEILSSVIAEPNIVAAVLYDEDGKSFAQYPRDLAADAFPAVAGGEGYEFTDAHLAGFEPVVQGNRPLGMLYLKSDMGAMYERFTLYGIIVVLVIAISLVMAYLLSKQLQKVITVPILGLSETAKAISDHHDYSVRAAKYGEDEIGSLTNAFNRMLDRIQEQTDEITSLNQNLEQKILERTRELQAVNKELEAFSYSVSHDLRAPLRSIHGYMNILLEEYDDKFDDEAKRIVGIVLTNGRRMGQLIDDLLTFSRLGRKALNKGNISMSDLVADVWAEQYEMEKHRDISIQIHDLPPVPADRITIKQVWTNLISNALKYTLHKAETHIEIGSFFENGDIVYYIKDNGAGFDMAYYGKLFGVFQRLHSDEEFQGTGVGLAIVERIIAKHGGKVWAQGALDEGASFYFSLRAVDDE